MFYIYMVTNTVNGKRYIGWTDDPEARFKAHRSKARNGTGYALHAAIRKHGEEAFTFRVIESCDTMAHAKDLERRWIRVADTFAATGHGYNLTLGGDGAHGYTHSEESLQKMSAAKAGKAPPNKDKPASEATRAKLVSAWAERHDERVAATPRGPEHHSFGKQQSEETKQKRRATWVAKKAAGWQVESGRGAKISSAKRGKKRARKTGPKRNFSEAHLANLRASQRRRWARIKNGTDSSAGHPDQTDSGL